MDQSNCPEAEDDEKVETSHFLPESLKRGKKLPELTWRDSVPQIIASCIAYCVVIQAGANMAYSTVLIGGLQTPKDGEININDDQASWIASLVTISLPLGSLLSGPLMDRFGRKITCILTCIPSTLSWLIFIFSNSLSLLYTGRIIAGISGGMSTASIVYVIEITHPRIRAMMLCLNSVFVSLGILLTCVLALFLDWRKIAMVFTALNTSFLFLLFIIPESPYWLICLDHRNDRLIDGAVNGTVNQALNESAEKVLDQAPNEVLHGVPNHVLNESGNEVLNQALSHSPNQALNKSPNQVLNESLSQSSNQVLNESLSQSPNQVLNKSPNRSLHKSLNKSLNTPPNHSNRSRSSRRTKAEKYLKWLNPSSEIYHQELNRIEESNPSKTKITTEDALSNNGILRIYLKALKSPTVYKPIILLFVILLVQQLSGAYVVIFYAISVFREIGGTFGNGLNEYGALVLLGIIRFIMSIITSLLSRKIGRRVLCIVSGLGMSFSMFFSAMLIYLTSCNGGGEQKWMLLVIVLAYVCMSSLGFMVIPWSLIGELLPISFRGLGGGIMVSVAYVIMFGVIKSYPFVLEAMGAQNVFFGFSIVSLMGTAVVYLFLPETLGKSFKEIEEYFEGGKGKGVGGEGVKRDRRV